VTFRLGAVLLVAWLALRIVLLVMGGGSGRFVSLPVGEHRLAGLYFRGEKPAATLLVAGHGAIASKETLLPICWEARRRGVDCLTVDHLGHGQSSPMPRQGTYDAMRASLALAVKSLGVPEETRVVFVGHSLGAVLGCGHAAPCERSVAIGQRTACGPAHEVWGRVHRFFGLADSYYALSHTLEPWTPRVVHDAVDEVTPHDEHGTIRVAVMVTLAWASFTCAALAALSFARGVRAWPLRPELRALAAAMIVWAGLILGSLRTLWFTLPVQPGDGWIMAIVVGASLGLGALARLLGISGTWWGSVVSFLVAETVMIGISLLFPVPEFKHLMAIPVGLLPVPCFFAAVAERLTRKDRGLLEATVFASVVSAPFVALLVPASA
jgi:pimeloyl-ACP methyl ester carboxylesterase